MSEECSLNVYQIWASAGLEQGQNSSNEIVAAHEGHQCEMHKVKCAIMFPYRW